MSYKIIINDIYWKFTTSVEISCINHLDIFTKKIIEMPWATVSVIYILDFFILIFIPIKFTSELSDCSIVHIIQSITGSKLDSPCFHSLWRSLSVFSHPPFGHTEFCSQQTERDLWNILFNLVRDRNMSYPSDLCKQ